MSHSPRALFAFFLVLIVGSIGFADSGLAAKKKKIDRKVVAAMEEFHTLVNGSEELLERSSGVLIFPSIKKAGIGIGGESGSGALIVDGITVAYYRSSSASIGFQLGYQERTQMLLFMTDESLATFRHSENWEIGADASVALVTLDAGGRLDTETISNPVIAFVYGATGLMYNLTLEGTKVSIINPK